LFGRIDEQFEVFDCLLEIEMSGRVQTQRMKAPRIMIEQQFESLVQQAVNNTSPIKIKMSRKVPIWSKFEDKWIEQENSIVFTNVAYGNSENY
jgi:hypothetical protein